MGMSCQSNHWTCTAPREREPGKILPITCAHYGIKSYFDCVSMHQCCHYFHLMQKLRFYAFAFICFVQSLCVLLFFLSLYFYESSFNGAGALVGVIYLDMWYLLLCLDFILCDWSASNRSNIVFHFEYECTLLLRPHLCFRMKKKRFHSILFCCFFFWISSKRSKMNCAFENNRWYGFWLQIKFYRTNRECFEIGWFKPPKKNLSKTPSLTV